MDELKLLAEMVAGLPAMALWVIAFFFGYKVVVVGSIYGVIRFVAARMFDWLSGRASNARISLDGLVISGSMEGLIAQLHRVRNICNHSFGGGYLHNDSVSWLREAIDDKIAKDDAKKGAA